MYVPHNPLIRESSQNRNDMALPSITNVLSANAVASIYAVQAGDGTTLLFSTCIDTQKWQTIHNKSIALQN